MHDAANLPDAVAENLRQLSDIAIWRHSPNEKETEDLLLSAYQLHTESGNLLGLAGDLRRLGSLYVSQGRLDQHALSEALLRYEAVENVLGQADTVYHTGRLQMRQQQNELAEASLLQALRLHTKAQSVSGRVRDLYELGYHAISQGQVEAGEELVEEARAIERPLRTSLGRSNAVDLLTQRECRRIGDRLLPDPKDEPLIPWEQGWVTFPRS